MIDSAAAIMVTDAAPAPAWRIKQRGYVV